MTVYDRIRERRKSLGLSAEEVAERLGLSPATIYRYESADIKSMGADKLEPLASVLSTRPAYLMGWSDDPLPPIGNQDSLTPYEHTHIKKYRACDERGKGMVDNVLDYEYARVQKSTPHLQLITRELSVYEEPAAAGLGNYLSGSESQLMKFPEIQIPHGTDFCVRISGTSMEPDVPDGSIVFVQSCPAIESGEVGIFNLNGESYCKKLYVDRERQEIRLISINPSYEPIVITEEDYLHTFGRVLGVAEEAL